MLKRLLPPLFALAALLAGAVPSFAQTAWPTPDGRTSMSGFVNAYINPSGQAIPASAGPYPSGATPVNHASGNVANAPATATLAAAVGKTTYICGFTITSTGSTAAAIVSPTITNLVTSTMTLTYVSVAGATASNQPLIVPLLPCIPANATNTTIVVTLPALGAGNTNATVNAWGFQL
jgi:hypothetical protein